MSDVFIAHVEEDADVALEIALVLEEAGYTTWCYEIDSIPGPSYLLQTGQAVEGSKAVVIVISPHSVSSRQITKEIVRAHESGKEFVPVLRGIAHIEFQNRQPEWREAVGAAASISIPPGGVAGILPRIIGGLKALGIQPGRKADGSRIAQIRNALSGHTGRSGQQEAERPALARKPQTEPATLETPPQRVIKEAAIRKKWRKPFLIASSSLAIVILAVVVVVLFGQSGSEPPPDIPGNSAPAATSTTPPPPLPTSSPKTLPPPLPTPSPTTTVAPAAPATRGSISGKVYDVKGQPMVKALVEAIGYKDGKKGWKAETDATGKYEIKDVPVGEYLVTTWMTDHVREWWKDAFSQDKAKPVSVSAPNDIPNINFVLEPGGTIAGTVKSAATGQPLIGVSVDAMFVDGSGATGSTTDQNGNYTISGLRFGQYKVKSPGGSGSGDAGYIVQYFKVKKDSGSADLVSISAQSPDALGINFALERGGSISGRITDEAGTPIANANVSAKNNAGGGGAQTDPQGYYVVKVLPSGEYTVTASAANRVFQLWPNTFLKQNSKPVSVTVPDNTPNINFSLEPGGTISGNVRALVTGQPVANVTVSAQRVDGSAEGSVATDQIGNFKLSGLPFGQYKVKSPGGSGSSDAGYSVQYFNGKVDSESAEKVTISAQSPNALGINFDLERGGSISGRITDEAGSPIAYADVSAKNAAGGGIAQTDPQGYYVIKGLRSGEYLVGASAKSRVSLLWPNAFLQQNSKPVSVTAPDNTPNINFSLAPGGTISGNVRQAVDLQPLANVTVYAQRVDGAAEGSAATDQNGNFKLSGLPFGQYKVKSPGGWGSGDAGYIVQYFKVKKDSGSADLVSISSQTPEAFKVGFVLGK